MPSAAPTTPGNRLLDGPHPAVTVLIGLAAGFVVIVATIGSAGLLTLIASQPDEVRRLAGLAILGTMALLVGLGLGGWKPKHGVIAAVVAGLTASALLLLARVTILAGQPYNPLVFGWPGMLAAVLLTSVGGWLGQSLGWVWEWLFGSVPGLARVGMWAALLWLSVEVTYRALGSLGLGAALGNPLAGDMAASFVGAPLAAWLVARYGRQYRIAPSAWGYDWSSRAILIGAGAGAVLVGLSFLTGLLDGALTGTGQELPSHLTTGLQAGAWVAALLLVVNGVVIPASEELAWRGVAQTAFVQALGGMTGLLITAVLFALKHVVVDGSLSRIVTLLVFGLVVGLVRLRWGTGSSTVTHMVANSIATAMLIAST